MMARKVTQFYSYLYMREDGTPYYVGKGSGRRAYRAEHGVHRPADRSRILIFPMLNEAEAFESEIALIELFGRKDNGTGCLRNLTDGGEGPSGSHHSQKTCEAISKSLLGNKRGVGNQNHLGHKVSEASRKIMSERKKALVASGVKVGFADPAKFALYANKQTGVPLSPERLTAFHSPESRAKAGLKRRGRKNPAGNKARWDKAFIKTVAWG